MAKWGEGDPRWIVEERPDAVNVNNWHWTEKNATPWSRDKLNRQFEGFQIADGDILVTIDKVDKLTGEASANNRKGKLIFFYEWDIVLKWSGRLNEGQVEASLGQIKIPNLSEENDLDEIEIQVTVDKTDADSDRLKQFMYNRGRDKIRDLLGKYLVDLKHEFSKGMILPKKDGEEPPPPSVKGPATGSAVNKINLEAIKSPPPALGCKINTGSVEMSPKFRCTASQLFDVLTRIDFATAFTAGQVKLDAVKGGE